MKTLPALSSVTIDVTKFEIAIYIAQYLRKHEADRKSARLYQAYSDHCRPRVPGFKKNSLLLDLQRFIDNQIRFRYAPEELRIRVPECVPSNLHLTHNNVREAIYHLIGRTTYQLITSLALCNAIRRYYQDVSYYNALDIPFDFWTLKSGLIITHDHIILSRSPKQRRKALKRIIHGFRTHQL